MSYPLGQHASREKKQEKKFLLRPASTNYLAQVRVPPEFLPPTETLDPLFRRPVGASGGPLRRVSTMAGMLAASGIRSGTSGSVSVSMDSSYASVAAKSETVSLDASDTPLGAIVRLQAQIGINGYMYPPEDLMLVQCFADFSVDYSQRGLYGNLAPMKPALNFPYYLCLQYIPYVLKRKHLVDELETAARNAIGAEQRRFGMFAKGYSALMLAIHNQRSFLEQREEDARALRKEQERRAYFDLAQIECFRAEQSGRKKIAMGERHTREQLEFTMNEILTHCSRGEKYFDYVLSQCEAEYRAWLRALDDNCRYKMLRRRMNALFDEQDKTFERCVMSFRAAYTACRVSEETYDAYETERTLAHVQQDRRKLQLATHQVPLPTTSGAEVGTASADAHRQQQQQQDGDGEEGDHQPPPRSPPPRSLPVPSKQEEDSTAEPPYPYRYILAKPLLPEMIAIQRGLPSPSVSGTGSTIEASQDNYPYLVDSTTLCKDLLTSTYCPLDVPPPPAEPSRAVVVAAGSGSRLATALRSL